MRQLVIDRSRWLRGQGGWLSSLRLKGNGKMCCLGFDALSRGFTEEEITGCSNPRMLFGKLPPDRQGLVEPWLIDEAEGADVNVLMGVNDTFTGDKTMVDGTKTKIDSEETRERLIREVFARRGVQVTFVDGPTEEVTP